MDSKDYFKDIYKDFFGVENISTDSEVKEVKKQEDIDMSNVFEDINNLYISDESKDLLKKILEYMRKYNEKLETNYISFQIVLEIKDYSTKKSIIDIINNGVKVYNYVKDISTNISFYHVDDKTNLNDIYNNNGVIIMEDLKGFELLDLNIKEKFMNDLKTILDSKKDNITIVCGSKDDINTFFLNDLSLKSAKFSFNITGIVPEASDIYEDIIQCVQLNDDDKIKLLDYITETYKGRDDFNSYKETLINSLTFNKVVPEVEKQKSMDEIFSELNNLVGLGKVKKVLTDLVDVMQMQEKNKDLKINSFNLHMVFLGNPGTGKTTVARIVANILYNLKYIKENKMIEVSSKDLVAEYVGQTAPKTNAVVEKALGGVLFVDEAYSLASKNGENTYNSEAIATLIQAMENHRDDLVVIFAGYTKEMQDFLNSNSGIVSRIGYTLEFEDYTREELTKIFTNFMSKSGFVVNDDALDYLGDIIDEHKGDKNFGNARFVRNIYEKTIIKHANNTKDKKQRKILKTITKDDISTDNLLM